LSRGAFIFESVGEAYEEATNATGDVKVRVRIGSPG
jgi:hypothetical protein